MSHLKEKEKEEEKEEEETSLKKIKLFLCDLATSQIKAQNIQQGKILKCLLSNWKLSAMQRISKIKHLMRKKKICQ